MDKNIDISMLLDVYGSILPKVQYESLDLYYNEDLSLSEIADNTGKSKQSVFDTLKRGENSLADMESKLGFLKKSKVLKDRLEEIKSLVQGREADKSERGSSIDLIVRKIEEIISNMA